jgi:hypothetical protein
MKSRWKSKRTTAGDASDNLNQFESESSKKGQPQPQPLENETNKHDFSQQGITTTKSGPFITTRNGAIQYAIAISVFLLGIILIVIAWAIPTMTTQNAIILTVIGFLMVILGMMHMIAIPTMFA